MAFRNLIIASLSDQVGKPKLSETDLNIVFTGDSLTAGGHGGQPDQTYPNMVKDWLTGKCKSVTFASFGIGGQSTKEMLVNDPAKVDPLVDSNKVNLIITWEDVNAILNDSVPAQENYNDFVTYVSGRKIAGYDYVIHNAGYYPRLPSNPLWDVTKPIHKEYLDLCLINRIAFVDVMNDFRNLANVGGAENQSQNPSYFYDEVHLLNDGYQEVADYVINESILKIFDL